MPVARRRGEIRMELARHEPAMVLQFDEFHQLVVFFFQAEDGIRGIGVTGVQTCALPISATAADLRARPYYPPVDARVYNWAGFYAGANVGYDWGKITNSAISPNGLAGGIQGGYNFQSGQFVFGGETDIQVTGANDTFAPYKFSNPWFGTLRARAGFAMNNILFYGTLGLAYGDVKGEFFGL